MKNSLRTSFEIVKSNKDLVEQLQRVYNTDLKLIDAMIDSDMIKSKAVRLIHKLANSHNISQFRDVTLLNPTQIYCLIREDNIVASVTKDINNIPLMISEEYSGIDVGIDSVEMSRDDFEYTINAKLFEDDGDVNDYKFTLSITANY